MLARWQVIETFIRRQTPQKDWRRGAELGVYEGKTFFYLLDAFPDLTMVGVDRWEATPGPEVQNRETGHVSYERLPMQEIGARVIERAAAYGARATIIQGDTAESAGQIADAGIDFIFVDANHDTDSVVADIRAWRPKVRDGGMIFGHDINWPSVQRAVTQEFRLWTRMPSNVWSAWNLA